MAELKTKPTDVDVNSFLDGVTDPQQREDSLALVKIMKAVTRQPPRMWGPSMIGFGEFHYVYASGHEGDTFLTGFSPRKGTLVLYFLCGLDQRFAESLKKLGKAKASKGCLYIKKLADVDLAVLREMIEANVAYLKAMVEAGKKARAEKKSRKK